METASQRCGSAQPANNQEKKAGEPPAEAGRSEHQQEESRRTFTAAQPMPLVQGDTRLSLLCNREGEALHPTRQGSSVPCHPGLSLLRLLQKLNSFKVHTHPELTVQFPLISANKSYGVPAFSEHGFYELNKPYGGLIAKAAQT